MCKQRVTKKLEITKYRFNRPVYVWWALTENFRKDKHGFIDRIGQDPRRLQLLFQSDADKSW